MPPPRASGCSPTALGGYAMGTVAGLRTRRYHGLLVVPVDGAGGRDARARLARRRRRRRRSPPPPADARVGERNGRSGGHEQLVAVRARRRPSALALAGRRRRARARARDDVRPHRASPSCTACSPRPGRCGWSCTPLCTWRDVHGERFARGAPAVEHRSTTASSSRAPTASAAPAGRPAASGTPASGARGGGARPRRPRGRVGRRAPSAPTLRAGRPVAVEAWAAPLGDAPPPGVEIVAAARRAARRALGDGGRDRRRRGAARARRRPVHRRHASGPDLRGRLPVVRRVVARLDDRRTRACSSPPAATTRAAHAAASRQHGLRGHAGQHRRHRHRWSTTPPTATLWFVHAVDRHVAATGDDDLAATLAPAVDADRSSTTSPARATASAPTPTTACCGRAPRASR